jgi:glycosyltransferase involved in cell wall biosynthesis
MKKILITGPVLTRSGYGEMARFAFRSLSRQDVDLYIEPTIWGKTGWLFEDSEERKAIENLIAKTQAAFQAAGGNPQFDISIQISIPNEWKKRAPINIGYTAGIETNMISPAWLEPSLQMDKIIVISEHAKSGFVNTIFGNAQGHQFKVTTPIEVVHLPYRNVEKKVIDLNLKHDFNFLAVCQWGPRKNLDQTIVGFLEEFRNEEVGLVLKVNTSNDSILDRSLTDKRLQALVSNFPNKKCSITLVHGHLSEGEIESFYTNPKIKAIVSTTHGEGYGLPLMEAAANELPVIATDWSGHTDFLYIDGKRMFGKIDYELKPIANEHVWRGVLEEGTSWAYPLMSSYKDKLREVYKDYGRFKSQAKKLAVHVRSLVSEQKLQEKFSSLASASESSTGLLVL